VRLAEPDGRPGYPGRVQATVHRFDPLTGSGAVITDTGTVIPFGPDVLAGTPLRHLRVGQRLTVVLDDDQPAAGPGPESGRGSEDDGGRRVVRFNLGQVGASGNQVVP